MPSAPPSPFAPRSRPAVRWGVFMAPQQNLGMWDAVGNIPAIASGSGVRGDTLTVSADATLGVDIDGITDVVAGDVLTFHDATWKLNEPLRPKVSDRIDWLKLADIHLGTNGHDFDTIQLDVLLTKAGLRVQDLNVPLGYSRLIEARQVDDHGAFTKIVAVGQLATQSQRLSHATETLTATARFDWFLFGERLTAYRIWDYLTSAPLLVEQDVVLNPSIDGQVEGNRSSKQEEVGSGGELANFWISPESLRTPPAMALQNQSRDSWDLASAVHSLCWLLNRKQTYVTNPTLADLQASFQAKSTLLLNNVRIPLGSSLPEALDDICEAMGYRWWIQHVVKPLVTGVNELQKFQLGGPTAGTFTMNYFGLITAPIPFSATAIVIQSSLESLANIAVGDVLVTGGPIATSPLFVTFTGNLGFLNVPQITLDISLLIGGSASVIQTTVNQGVAASGDDLQLKETVLRFDKNGKGVVQDLMCQRVGDAITSDETNIADYDAKLEIATPNVVYGRGSPVQREGTFYLVPGWRVDQDNTSVETINAASEFDEIQRDVKWVGRFWALNESGDYGDRPGVEKFTDLEPLFGRPTRIVRRRFLPCLTNAKKPSERAQRGSGGVYVEWQNDPDEPDSWEPWPGSWSVAQHQAGIVLGGTFFDAFWKAWQTKRNAVGAVGELPRHVRVTACLEGDSRQSYKAPRREQAPNGRDIPQHLDLDHRFHDRLVKLSGDFVSRWDENHFAITGVQPAAPQHFLIGSDVIDRLKPGNTFIVRDSKGNDGRYTVDVVALVAGVSTRIVVKEKIFDSTVDGMIGLDTEESADRPALIRYCEEARDAHDGAKVAVSAVLKGHDHLNYGRGDVVSAVQPRNLLLNNYHNLAPSKRYPQIVGINYRFTDDSQRTELVLEVPEAERPELERSRYGG